MTAHSFRPGSQADAFAAAADTDARAAALRNYDNRAHTTSSIEPRVSLWETWQRLHLRWFGHGPEAQPVLPLTPYSLNTITAMLIAGGYRSSANYVSRAKDEHTRDFEWTSMLAREQRRANAAAKRGLGPAHQSA